MRLLAAELGEHGIKVNGVNPDGVVQGSGIFAGGWGAKRAAVYGVRGEGPRRVLRPAHPAQARGAARARRQRGVRAVRRRTDAHHRAAHPGRRGRRGGLPAMSADRMTTLSSPSTSAPPGAGDGRPGRRPDGSRSRRCTGSPTARCATPTAPALGHRSASTARCSSGSRRRPQHRPGRRHRHRLLGGRLRPARRGRAAARRRRSHYRDARTDGVAERCVARASAEPALYDVTGLQQLPFNTLYQLVAARDIRRRRGRATTLLLLPDLLALLAHRRRRAPSAPTPRPPSSTTPRTREWAHALLERARPPHATSCPPLRRARRRSSGRCCPRSPARSGCPPSTPVIAVGSHDTASAVVGVPASDAAASAYISSGTWSLVGLELRRAGAHRGGARRPTSPTRAGVDGTVRFLQQRHGPVGAVGVRARLGDDRAITDLGRPARGGGRAAALRAAWSTSTTRAPRRPATCPAGIGRARRAQRASRCPRPPAEMTRLRPGQPGARRTDARVADRRRRSRACDLEVVHVVGGGSQNGCSASSPRTRAGCRCVAGPAEAAALGNVLVQARDAGRRRCPTWRRCARCCVVPRRSSGTSRRRPTALGRHAGARLRRTAAVGLSSR